MSDDKPNKFASIRQAVDPQKLAEFAAGSETRQMAATPAAPSAVTPPSPAVAAPQPPVPTIKPAKELPRSILIRLADTPGLAEKLHDVFQRSTYKSQQQMVVALLDEALDRLDSTLPK